MQNRLQFMKQLMLLLTVLFFSWNPALLAQSCDNSNSTYTFTYNGPDTIFLGSNCTDSLNWYAPGPLTTPTLSPAAGINIFAFDAALTGYAIDDPISGASNVQVYYILDALSGKDTFCFELVFADTLPPVLDPPPGNVIVCPEDIPNSLDLMATDNCDGSFMVTSVDDMTLPADTCLAMDVNILRTWTATDAAGNSSTTTQQVVVKANSTPVINMMPVGDTIACDLANYGGWLNTQRLTIMLNSTDDCGIETITDDAPVSLDTLCGGVTVTFTVTDSCGLSASAMATYAVIDTVAPVFINLPNPVVIINCDDSVPSAAAVTVSDNCDPNVSLSFSENSSQTSDGSCTDFDYTIIRTWMATDVCGNMAEFIQTITVEDTEAPTFSMPGDLNLQCTQSTDTTATGTISGLADNCDMAVGLNYVENIILGSCPQSFTIERTWTASDACGNATTHTQTINVLDNSSPVFLIPNNKTVQCDDADDMDITGVPTFVSDNCDTMVVVAHSDVIIPGGCPNSYTIERTWSGTDDCGNVISGLQTITVIDSEAPTFSTTAQPGSGFCSDPDLLTIFNDWITANGNAIAADNCSDTGDFMWFAYNAGTTDNANLMTAGVCTGSGAGIYSTMDFDFVVRDECLNQSVSTATFAILDNTPPVLSNCPSNEIVNTDPGLCSMDYNLALPKITEECGNTILVDSVSQTHLITTGFGVDTLETPVDDIVFNFSVPTPPVSSSGDVNLQIDLTNIDAEQPTEFFNILGEDGTLLGTTNLSAAQCSSSTTLVTISETQFNDWAFDGMLTITLSPNIPSNLPGRFAINHICAGGSVTGKITYDATFPDGLTFEYSINGAPRVTVSPVAPINTSLSLGNNNIVYYFTDCAGNEATCSYLVMVEDDEDPEIICPSSFSELLDTDECQKDVTVPLFLSATDNCAIANPTIQSQPTDVADEYISFSFNPNLNDFLADDKPFTFTGLVADATPGSVELIVTIQGDIESLGEYFVIEDPDGNEVGNTQVGQAHVTPGDCNTQSTATFNISSALFNIWAADGNLTFTARSFMSFPIPPGGPGSGINPCDVTAFNNSGSIDSVSTISATLIYESVSPIYEATGATTIAMDTLMPPLAAPVHTFDWGVTTVSYGVTDLYGNSSSCSFDIEVVDNQFPIAECNPAFVEINPSGFVQDIILPEDVDAGSSDNCPNFTMTVAPDLITCNLADSLLNVVLTVTDQAGNTDVCTTFVAVSVEPPQPFAISDCGSDTLRLFANPPAVPNGNNIYQYEWSYGGVVFSFEENPIVPDADDDNSGFYTVSVRGVTGCEAQSSVSVACEDLPLKRPTISAANNIICSDDPLDLTTDEACGNGVQYNWYEGTAPNGVLVATTTDPFYTVPAPHNAGMTDYYIQVERNGCVSEVSLKVSVDIIQKPDAIPFETSFLACAGDTIDLGAFITVPGLTCQWTGPSGYSSSSCDPAPIEDIAVSEAGLYELVTTFDGCASDITFVVVNVLDQPIKPDLFNPTSITNPACEGDTVIMTATPIPGALSYEWTSPSFELISTPSNVLTLTDVEVNGDAGDWTCRAIGNPCHSQVSDPSEVFIVKPPQAVTAAANPDPACEGEDVQLSASSGSQNVSFLWTFPDAQSDALQNPIIPEVMHSDSGEYKLTVTNEFGCRTETSVNLEVLTRVQAFASNDAPNCSDGSVDVNLIVFPLIPANDGTYTFIWEGPNMFECITQDTSCVIPNAASDDSGQYRVTVINGEGCESLEASTMVFIPEAPTTPTTPTLSDNGPFCEGDELTICTSAISGDDVEYQWFTPLGDTIVSGACFNISSLSTANSGGYSVLIIQDDCPSAQSNPVNVVVNPIPVAQGWSNSPACEGGELELSANCDPNCNFIWTGPAGFSATVCNPVRTNLQMNHSGTYTVIKTLDGCESDPIEVNVIVKPKPNLPIAINFGPYCSDSEDVVVAVGAGSETAGANYNWYDGVMQPLGSTPSLSFTIPGAAQYGQGNFDFFVEADLDECTSVFSIPTTVHLDTLPNQNAFAGADMQICENDPAILQSTPPTVGEGRWELVSGNSTDVIIVNPTSSNTEVTGLHPDEEYIFSWVLSNGACEDYSTDEVMVTVDILEDADPGPPIIACQVTSLNLNATPPTSNVGTWSQTQEQAIFVTIEDPSDPNTLISNLTPGNTYIFTWTINGGCGESSSTLLVNISNDISLAVSKDDCGDGCTELCAIPPEIGEGIWTTLDPSIEIISPNDPNSFACNLQEGENVFIWTIHDGMCGPSSVDTAIIDYRFEPIAEDDAISIEFGGSTDILVTGNDFLPEHFFVNVLTEPSFGTLSSTVQGLFSYQADLNFIGQEIITYELCSETCDCSIAQVVFNIGDEAKCEIPSIITPNNDGINDAFMIPCLARWDIYANNQLSIFNQWGDEIFRSAPYLNDWKGTFDGEPVPPGTYFYVLDLGTGDAPESGYLIIQR